LKEKGVKGIIVDSIHTSDIESSFGDEVYSGVTGKIDKGMTIIILNSRFSHLTIAQLCNYQMFHKFMIYKKLC
jgi:hypothetical protein